MALAGVWYTSGTLYAAAGAIAAVMGCLIAAFVAFKPTDPVRRLECAMSAAPLLQGSAQDMPGLLSITWEGAELKDPSILEVNLVNRGRRDIVSGDFEQPLEFGVGVRIFAVLKSACGPNSTVFRAVAFDDDLLKIGPGLIPRRQTIKFTLLASGRAPKLSSSAAAVHNVDVKVLPTEQLSHRRPLRIKVAGALAVVAAMVVLVLGGLLIGHDLLPAEQAKASATPTVVLQPALQITSPRNGTILHGNQAVLVEGTAKNLGVEQLWIFVLRLGSYYVSNVSPLSVISGKWKYSDPYVGNSSQTGVFQINAVLADASCDTAINSAPQQSGGGVSFSSLPHGCHTLYSVRVVR